MVLTQKRVKEVLNYNPVTGEFIWKVNHRRRGYGKRAGSVARTGRRGQQRYRKIGIDGKTYFEHKLAWLYVHGVWPKVVDHVNGNPLDNRISNIRQCTQRQNMMNCKKHSDHSSSPYKGVYKQDNRYVAKIGTEHGRIYLGMFTDALAAARAYDEAALKYHGEFARLNFPR